MRIVLFGSERRVGALAGERVLDLNRADPRIPADLLALIEGGPGLLDLVQRAVDQIGGAPDGAVEKASAVKLHAPWPGRRVMMAGTNFLSRTDPEVAGMSDDDQRKALRQGQRGFWKVHLVAAGPDEEIAKPKRTKYLNYEGEPVIVLGRKVKDAKAEDIAGLVWGVTLLNDICITERPGAHARERFAFDKNFDGSFTLGPSIVIGEGVDFADLPIETRVNGTLRQSFSSKDMVYSFGEMIAYGSRDFTLFPGDVFSGGTGDGSATDLSPKGLDGTVPTDLFLQHGDVVEVSSPKIGTLRNRIV